jgi:hypothetical protein
MIIQQQPWGYLFALISITIILSSAYNSNPPKSGLVLPEQLLTSIRTDSFVVYSFAKKEVPYIDGFIFDQPGKYQKQAMSLLGRLNKESDPVWLIVE